MGAKLVHRLQAHHQAAAGPFLQVVSPFIDPVTSKKIVFLYEKDPSQMRDSFNSEVRTELVRQPHTYTVVPLHHPRLDLMLFVHALAGATGRSGRQKESGAHC